MAQNNEVIAISPETSENKNSIIPGGRKYPNLSKMRSLRAISDIIKWMKTPDAVIDGFDSYMEFVLNHAYEETIDKNAFSYSMKTARTRLFDQRRMIDILLEVDDESVFLSAYPAVIAKHFMNTKNPYSPDDAFWYFTKNRSSVKRAPAGIPIPGVYKILDRTQKIVVKRFKDWDGSYSMDAEASREFFRRCLELADENQEMINTIKSQMEELDRILIAGPEKNTNQISVSNGMEIVTTQTNIATLTPEFLKWDENFKGNSENLILKKLSNIARDKKCLEKKHIDDILDTLKTLYIETGKIEVFLKKQKDTQERMVANPSRRFKTDVEIYPISACCYSSSDAPSGFKKWELPSGVFFRVLSSILWAVRTHSEREVFIHCNERLANEFGVYSAEDLLVSAFAEEEWATKMFSRTGYELDSLGNVQVARLFLMEKSERDIEIKERAKIMLTVKSSDEFFQSVFNGAKMYLKPFEKSDWRGMDYEVSPRDLIMGIIPNPSTDCYSIIEHYTEAFLRSDSVLDAFKRVISSAKSLEELFSWKIGEARTTFIGANNEITARDIFSLFQRAIMERGSTGEYRNEPYQTILETENLDILSRMILLSMTSYRKDEFIRNVAVPYIRKSMPNADSAKALAWAMTEIVVDCRSEDSLLSVVMKSYQKRTRESAWEYVDKSKKERITNEELYPVAFDAFMETDDGKIAKELLDSGAFGIADFDYVMASFFVDADKEYREAVKMFL